jgi:hypothetical protein
VGAHGDPGLVTLKYLSHVLHEHINIALHLTALIQNVDEIKKATVIIVAWVYELIIDVG